MFAALRVDRAHCLLLLIAGVREVSVCGNEEEEACGSKSYDAQGHDYCAVPGYVPDRREHNERDHSKRPCKHAQRHR